MERERRTEMSQAPGSPSPALPAEPDPRIEEWLDRACAPLVGLAPYHARLELRERYRTRLDELVARQREAGYSHDEAVRRALSRAGKPTRMSGADATEWQLARGSLRPAVRVALWCFSLPWLLVMGPRFSVLFLYATGYLQKWFGWCESLHSYASGHPWLAVAFVALAAGALAGVLGRRRQVLGTFCTTGALAIVGALLCLQGIVAGIADPEERRTLAGILVSGPLWGTLGAALSAALRARRGAAAPPPSDPNDLTDAERVEEYLDGVCMPLVDVLPYPTRAEIRAELGSHLDSLIAAYQEVGCGAGEAVTRAIERCGHPDCIARAWVEEPTGLRSAAGLWRTTRIAFASFSVALGITLAAGSLVARQWMNLVPVTRPIVTELLMGMVLLLPAAAGLAIRRRVLGGSTLPVALAVVLLAGLLQVGARLSGDDGPLGLMTIVLLVEWLPVGCAVVGLGGWLRRVRRWLATKDRPLSA